MTKFWPAHSREGVHFAAHLPAGLALCILMVFWTQLASSQTLLECDCDRYCATPTCQTDGVCFVSVMLLKNGTVDRSTRCIDKHILVPSQRPIVCDYNQRQAHTYKHACCRTPMCNRVLNLTLSPAPVQDEAEHTLWEPSFASPAMSYEQLIITLVLLSLTLVLLVVVLVGCARARCWPKCGWRAAQAAAHLDVTHYHEVASCETRSSDLAPMPYAATGSGSGELDDMWQISTGSGSGLPLLVQRSVARQVTLINIIGQGRFGEVWRGHWRGEPVAVKIFTSFDEQSWFREVEIYQTVMLRHENVLGFIAADNKDNGTWTQLWLITEYMELGSLYDFLRRHVVTCQRGLEMCLNIATGLAHLHMDIVGTHGKPAIAHRDLKSKNVLIRQNGICAVGDLGLAVRYDATSNVLDLPETSKVGTKRYLAPEVLNDTLNVQYFEEFKRADIYALGLVIWEIATRSTPLAENRQCPDYQLPYQSVVGSDPGFEDMRKVVGVQGIRPDCPNFWQQDSVFHSWLRVMRECWYENPSSRSTALRVKKSLGFLNQEVQSKQPEIKTKL